mgnify:CR=1 FL=1
MRRRRTRKHSVDCICLVLSSRIHAHARPYRSGCLLACLRGCRVVEVLAVSLSVGTRGHTHALSCSTSLSRFFGGPRCCWVIREEPASESEIPFDLARTERIVHSNTDTNTTTGTPAPGPGRHQYRIITSLWCHRTYSSSPTAHVCSTRPIPSIDRERALVIIIIIIRISRLSFSSMIVTR